MQLDRATTAKLALSEIAIEIRHPFVAADAPSVPTRLVPVTPPAPIQQRVHRLASKRALSAALRPAHEREVWHRRVRGGRFVVPVGPVRRTVHSLGGGERVERGAPRGWRLVRVHRAVVLRHHLCG